MWVTFATSFIILVTYSVCYYRVLKKTKREAVKENYTSIVLVSFLISFIFRTSSDFLRLIMRKIENDPVENVLEKIIATMNFVVSISSTAK